MDRRRESNICGLKSFIIGYAKGLVYAFFVPTCFQISRHPEISPRRAHIHDRSIGFTKNTGVLFDLCAPFLLPKFVRLRHPARSEGCLSRYRELTITWAFSSGWIFLYTLRHTFSKLFSRRKKERKFPSLAKSSVAFSESSGSPYFPAKPDKWYIDYRLVLLGSMFPNIVDRPLGILLFPNPIKSSL